MAACMARQEQVKRACTSYAHLQAELAHVTHITLASPLCMCFVFLPFTWPFAPVLPLLVSAGC